MPMKDASNETLMHVAAKFITKYLIVEDETNSNSIKPLRIKQRSDQFVSLLLRESTVRPFSNLLGKARAIFLAEVTF